MQKEVDDKQEHQDDLQFVATDDEAAQYYDRLTCLFQETREKLKEFNNDFQRRGAQGSNTQTLGNVH